MSRFPLKAVTKRVVTDTVSVVVEAKTLDSAIDRARQALDKYPNEHEVPGISFCRVENRENGDVNILSIEEEEDYGVSA